MIEKWDDCPACGESRRWDYDLQVCHACGEGKAQWRWCCLPTDQPDHPPASPAADDRGRK